jgi:hypothetical protein
MNRHSRDTTGLEAGRRVIYRRTGTAAMHAGRIEWIDVQKPFPTQVLLDDGETVLALCHELMHFPLEARGDIDAFLDEF